MAASDDISFTELVDAYYQPLYKFAYSLSKSPDEAADLTQQTFYIWAKKGNTLRDASKVKSWLFTSLYREFLRPRGVVTVVFKRNHRVQAIPLTRKSLRPVPTRT